MPDKRACRLVYQGEAITIKQHRYTGEIVVSAAGETVALEVDPVLVNVKGAGE